MQLLLINLIVECVLLVSSVHECLLLVIFIDTLEGVFVMSIHLKIVVITPPIFMDQNDCLLD